MRGEQQLARRSDRGDRRSDCPRAYEDCNSAHSSQHSELCCGRGLPGRGFSPPEVSLMPVAGIAAVLRAAAAQGVVGASAQLTKHTTQRKRSKRRRRDVLRARNAVVCADSKTRTPLQIQRHAEYTRGVQRKRARRTPVVRPRQRRSKPCCPCRTASTTSRGCATCRCLGRPR